ncbi:MAG: branched-chain amino acid ABC transporter permease [Acidilobaceae archaeon]
MPILSIDFLINGLASGAALALLCLGLTLTYMTTRVPNFAHATIAVVGAVVTLLLLDWVYIGLRGGAVYYTLYIVAPILSALIAGLLALTIYIAILRPLSKKGIGIIGLMIATFALDIIINNILTLILHLTPSKYIGKLIGASVKGYGVLVYIPILDVNIYLSRLLLPIIAVILTISLHLYMTRTKFGIAMRASIENPQLAKALGINVDLVYAISWFLSGSLAGIAGSLLAFEFPGINPAIAYLYIVSIFAGSILGGLSSMYGALAGGLVVGVSEVLIPVMIQNIYYTITGSIIDIIRYQKFISLLIIIIVLLVAPQGLAGVSWRNLLARVVRVG